MRVGPGTHKYSHKSSSSRCTNCSKRCGQLRNEIFLVVPLVPTATPLSFLENCDDYDNFVEHFVKCKFNSPTVGQQIFAFPCKTSLFGNYADNK